MNFLLYEPEVTINSTIFAVLDEIEYVVPSIVELKVIGKSKTTTYPLYSH